MTAIFKHHDLTVERTGDQITLTQQTDYSEPDMVMLHPWQLRAVCEQFGLIASCGPAAAKTIATLTRRLLVLRDRIDSLADYMRNHSDHKHADLSFETMHINATADIAAEFVAELDDVQTVTEPPERAPERVEPSAGTDPRQQSIDA